MRRLETQLYKVAIKTTSSIPESRPGLLCPSGQGSQHLIENVATKSTESLNENKNVYLNLNYIETTYFCRVICRLGFLRRGYNYTNHISFRLTNAPVKH
jgi:hypothetical protein